MTTARTGVSNLHPLNGFLFGVVAAVLLIPSVASAQLIGPNGIGLPPVFTPGGWSRYLAWSPQGPVPVLVSVGKTELYRGAKGTWIQMESRIPGMDPIKFELMVRPEEIGMRVLRMRKWVPGKGEEAGPPEALGTSPKPKRVGKGEAEVAGEKLPVLLFETKEGIPASWSSRVPGIGLVRMGGPAPMQLVAFGIGGDPWAGVEKTMTWPKDLVPTPMPEPTEKPGARTEKPAAATEKPAAAKK